MYNHSIQPDRQPSHADRQYNHSRQTDSRAMQQEYRSYNHSRQAEKSGRNGTVYIHISPREDNCDDNDESYTQYPVVVVGRSLRGKWEVGGGGRMARGGSADRIPDCASKLNAYRSQCKVKGGCPVRAQRVCFYLPAPLDLSLAPVRVY